MRYQKVYFSNWSFQPIIIFNRLLGYANEVGEAFRALVHVNWVRLSYGVASAYVLADTNDKAGKTAASLPENEEGRTTKIAAAAFDTLLWQALASVIIPGFTINRICAGSLIGMAKVIPQVRCTLLTKVFLLVIMAHQLFSLNLNNISMSHCRWQRLKENGQLHSLV